MRSLCKLQLGAVVISTSLFLVFPFCWSGSTLFFLIVMEKYDRDEIEMRRRVTLHLIPIRAVKHPMMISMKERFRIRRIRNIAHAQISYF